MTDLPKIGKPATNALGTVEIDQIEQLSSVTKSNLAHLHGVGPKAIEILEKSLLELGLSFSLVSSDLPDLPFFLIGDLACDNAPKRRIARDLAMNLYAKGLVYDGSLMVDEVVYKAPYNDLVLTGRDQVLSSAIRVTDISSIEVFQILSHGKEAALHGKIVDKQGTFTYFSMFFVFASHKKDSVVSQIVHYQQI